MIVYRFGFFRWKVELEDRVLCYVYFVMYYKVFNLVKVKKVECESNINNVIDYIKELFKELDLINFEIKGRIKNIYFIYKKMIKDM